MPNRCLKCGKILDGSNICPVCGSGVDNVDKHKGVSEKIICGNCGKVYQNKSQVCPICGTKNTICISNPSVSIHRDVAGHCPNCGKKLRTGEENCSVCGCTRQNMSNLKPISKLAQIPTFVSPIQASTPAKQRHSLLYVILPIVAVVAVVAGVTIYRLASSIFPAVNHTNTDNADELVTAHQTIGKALSDVMSTDEFDTADINTRKELVDCVLDDMQKQGYIQDPVYNTVSEIYEYDYTAGGKGGVMLVEFSPDVNGISKNYADRDSSGKVINIKNRLEYDTSKYSYKENNLTAKVMYGLGFDDTLEKLKTRNNVWNSEGLSAYIDEDCTVEDFANGLGDCSFLDIQEHGMMYDEEPIICTQDLVTDDNITKYSDDIFSGRIILLTEKDEPNKSYYGLMPDFFTNHYTNNELKNTIVNIGCCKGYKNDKLVDAFKCAGAKSVLGCTETVYTDYDYYIVDAMVYSLLSGDTVDEALKYATDMWGGDDIQWAKNYVTGDIKSQIAVPKIACGGDQRLVTVIEKEESKTPKFVKEIVSWTAEREPGGGDTWIDTFEMYESYRDKYGFNQNEMWFQDIDGDGTPELIIGGYGMCINDPEEHFFSVYNENGLVEYGLTTMWTNHHDYGHKAFTLHAYKDSSGNLSFADGELFEYTNSDHPNGDGAYGLYTYTFGNSDNWTKAEEKFYFIKNSENGGNEYDSFKVNDSSVDAENFKSSFNSYFSGKTPLKANVKTILLNDYKNMTQPEREQVLTESYNAFSYEEDSTISAPLSDMVNSISANSSDNLQEQNPNTPDPFAVYANKLEKLYAEKSDPSSYYFVLDLDFDGEYELVWVDEGGASTSEARVFRVDSSGHLADLGTFNCGGRALLWYSSYYGCFVTDYVSSEINEKAENIEIIDKISISSEKVITEKLIETSVSERDTYGFSLPVAGYSYNGGGANEVRAIAMSNQY